MAQDQKKPYRLAGMCKKCHELRFGYLLYGRGPFICYQCAEQAAKRIPVTPNTTITNPAEALHFSYTFTTSNSTSSTWPSEVHYQGLHYDHNDSGASQT